MLPSVNLDSGLWRGGNRLQEKISNQDRTPSVGSWNTADIHLRETLDACPIGVAILARDDGRRLFVNMALVRMLGASSRDQLLKGDITQTWADPRRLEQAWSAFRIQQSLVNFEAERIRIDGTRCWMLLNTQPIMFEDVPAGIVWHVDISPRKRAEEALQESETRLSEAVENLSDAFAMFDRDDRLVLCNRMFRELNPALAPVLKPGLTFEEMIRDNVRNGRIVRAIGRDEAFLQERLAQHRDPTGPLLSQRTDGRWLLLRERRMPDGSTCLVQTDLTELKKREEALLAEKERAEKASGIKSQFLATMSHELRTPLNAILGFSEVLLRELFGPLGDRRYQEYATDIFTSGQHLLDLINDVLDLSRIEAGRYELSLAEVDTAALLTSTCDVLREMARNKGLHFETRISPDIPRIRADGRALRQIFFNLLSNAIKFTPAGGRVRVDAVANERRQPIFTISDTGIGIAKEDIAAVVTPFTRIASTEASGEGGTGLGLAIVDALVEMHGGTLAIESRLGHGTSVSVRLPHSCVLD